MDRAADRSITLLRNGSGTLPVTADPAMKVLVTGWGASGTTTMTAQVASHGVIATRLYTGGAPASDDRRRGRRRAEQRPHNRAQLQLWGDPDRSH